MAINKKTGYVKPKRLRKCKDQTFTAKWGISADSLAQLEDVATASIHMRVRNYGTPWQRANRPSLSEELCGKTIYQLADELSIHPISVQQRIKKYGNPYLSNKDMISEIPNGKYRMGRKKCWLMEQHPCYAEWKEQKDKQNAELYRQGVLKQQKKKETS